VPESKRKVTLNQHVINHDNKFITAESQYGNVLFILDSVYKVTTHTYAGTNMNSLKIIYILLPGFHVGCHTQAPFHHLGMK